MFPSFQHIYTSAQYQQLGRRILNAFFLKTGVVKKGRNKNGNQIESFIRLTITIELIDARLTREVIPGE